MQQAGIDKLAVPEDFLLGRVLGHNVVDKETGEVMALANDEITEVVLAKLREANIEEIQTIYTNDLDQGAYISQTLRIDETADQMAAQVAIYRMMRPANRRPRRQSKRYSTDCFMRPNAMIFCSGANEIQSPRG